MANAIKYSLSGQTLALNKGNFWIGVGDVGKSPTSSTDYWNGISPPLSGYTIYLNRASGIPSVYPVSSDTQLISLTNSIGSQNFSTATQCLNWFATQSDKIIVNKDYETIITSGLTLNLDAGFTPSYPTTGTSWYNVGSNNVGNGTLVNGPTYSSSNGGCIVFDGVDDYVTYNNPPLTNEVTLNLVLNSKTGDTTQQVFAYTSIGTATVALYAQIVKQGSIFYMQILVSGYAAGYAEEMNVYYSSDITSYLTSQQSFNYTFTWKRTPGVNSTLKTYINGVFREQQINTNNFWSNTANLGTAKYRAPATFLGKLSLVQIYDRELSATEISQNYEAQKARYSNYFPNGDFKLGNTNFTYGTANSSVTMSGMPYSLQMKQEQYTTMLSDTFIQVDTSKKYQYNVYTRTLTKGGTNNDVLSAGHMGFACYDSSQRFIELNHCGGLANTILTRDLLPGDSYAYVSSSNNQWTSSGQSYYFRYFMVYPPSHPEFNKKWEYTRIGSGTFYIYFNEVLDIGGGELRIKFCNSSDVAATFPNIGYATPIGTGVMNGSAGGTFNYVFYPTTGAYGEWSQYTSSVFTGENKNSNTPFRYGTKYIKWLHLINYGVAAGTTPLPIMLIGGTELKQIQ
jgi:hypothetical protein